MLATTQISVLSCLMDEQHRSCKCGAVYRRTESMAKSREVNSFECIHCGETLEHWNSAWVPTYRLIVGPVKTIG
jgi:predicted SprT family Zn-dependent metalloprotease